MESCTSKSYKSRPPRIFLNHPSTPRVKIMISMNSILFRLSAQMVVITYVYKSPIIFDEKLKDQLVIDQSRLLVLPRLECYHKRYNSVTSGFV